MSKLPVREVNRQVLSPRVEATLALIQGLLPAMTAILGGLWVVSTYLDQQKASNTTRLLEAQKPVYEKQLTL
jgi:hypothetical protein